MAVTTAPPRARLAAEAHAVTDALGMPRFAPLAAATIPGGWVSRVGIASRAGLFQLIPGALGGLDDNDRAAVPLLTAGPRRRKPGFMLCVMAAHADAATDAVPSR